MEGKSREIVIATPQFAGLELRIRGITPLLCSNGEQAINALSERDQAKAGKTIKTPEEHFRASLYTLNGGYGFPASAISRALRDASARFVDKFSGKTVAGAIRIIAPPPGTLVPIEGDAPVMDTAHVVHGRGSHDLAYRARFDRWEIPLVIRHNANAISADQIVTLLNIAGFSVGIGAWRPEKNGSFGQFSVAEDSIVTEEE